ncbi:MAG: hypothetical protein RI907_28 [Pseudomonadota bacterium]|jgi:SagB-type dehydrogenase family enzyme
MRTRLNTFFQPRVASGLGPVAGPAEAVMGYHERTKHRLQGFAAGPDTLDWDAQPAAFRHWHGAPRALLPLCADAWPATWGQVRAGTVAPAPLDRVSLAMCLEMALGLTAWKRLGPDRWALRANPSSGNLHPIEAWLLTRDVPGLPDGLCHYDPQDHALTQRAAGRLTGGDASGAAQAWVALSSVAWREAWKYGERAFRYVELDAGHALGAVAHAAAALGWRVRPVTTMPHAALATLLGLDRDDDFGEAEREEPEMLLALVPRPNDGGARTEAQAPLGWPDDVRWLGQPSVLDPRPMYRWPVVDEVAVASRDARPEAPGAAPASEPVEAPALWRLWGPAPHDDRPASLLLRSRRSAQRFDARAQMPRAACLRLLASTLANVPGATAATNSPQVQLVVYAHRVQGLAPGAYLLPRSEAGRQALTALLKAPQGLGPVSGWPAELPLLTLAEHPALAGTLRTLSCHQAIGSDACLAVSMVAPLAGSVLADPHGYRQLLREAGAVGQALYVQAEAEGLRGTGVGCYFDDAVHDLLGLTGGAWQVLYHFTVGLPLVDPRLASEPPYTAERQAQDTGFVPPSLTGAAP